MPDTIILSLEDHVVGRLLSTDAKSVIPRVDGGSPGPGRLQTLSSIEPITLVCGAYHSSAVMFWAGATLDHTSVRRNATLTAVNLAKKTATVAEMFNCLVSEIALPALDRDSKADAAMRLKIESEGLKTRSGVTDIRTALSAPAPKAWKVSDFEFAIDEVEGCESARTISSLSVKQGIKKHFSGKDRSGVLEPTKLATDNIIVTIPIERGNAFFKWLKETQEAPQGRSGSANQRSGELRYLAGDKSVVAVVELHELGIVSVSVGRPHIKVELYCGHLKLRAGGGF